MSKVAVFGGMFDPPHLGHMNLAVKALDVVDQICFVPCLEPNHKDGDYSSYQDRLKMVKLMTEYNPKFFVSDIENRPGKSYMSDTLDSFNKIHNCYDISLLIGLDSLATIHQWHRFEDILKTFRIIVYDRARSSFKCVDELRKLVKSPINLLILDGELSDMSSSTIRYWLKQDRLLVKNNLDKDVYDYIIEKNLYECDKGVE